MNKKENFVNMYNNDLNDFTIDIDDLEKTSNIYYISLGSFCHPKILLRETKREFLESLPFDFNSTPHMATITNILNELHETKSYNLKFHEILWKYNDTQIVTAENTFNKENPLELAVSDKNNMYLVHFFKECDIIESMQNNSFPMCASNLKENIINEVQEKYKKRFDRLLNILNSPNNILCFLRIENYYNYDWHNELLNLTKVLSLFNNPRKYLIYSQELINDKLHFDNCRELNYDYNIPIMFIKHYFYDKEMINNKILFITILSTFEYLMESSAITSLLIPAEIMRKAPDFC
jgi:hypothetical protein